MNHIIIGVLPNEEFASFEQELSLPTPELARIMEWKSPEDCMLDFQLTKDQICKIEKACALKLPGHLDLFLSSHE